MISTLVVAHRGASGYLPEHTLEAYAMAIGMGATSSSRIFVVTKDGILIRPPRADAERHDRCGEPARIRIPQDRTRKVDGVETTDWFAGDFTLAEIKQMRAEQAMADRDQSKNGTVQDSDPAGSGRSRQEGSGREGTRSSALETKHPTFRAAIVDCPSRIGWWRS